VDHPVTTELQDVGAITESGEVDAAILEWLTVLSRRDMALLLRFRIPGEDHPACALLARFAQWWVVMERSGDFVRIGGAGVASAEGTAAAALGAQLDRLCGTNDPASLRPVTLAVDALRTAARSADEMREFLRHQGLDGDQLRMLLLATDIERSAQVSIVALQSGVDTGRPTRTHVEQSAVTIVDTPEGRLVTENITTAGREWMIVAPGTKSNVASAIGHLLHRLPADEWHSYRKVV
jgi:hypothetical protein